MSNLIDLKDLRQGKLTILYKIGWDIGRSRTMWACICDCGNKFNISTHSVRRGQQSCKDCSKAAIKHNLSHTPEYGAWRNMISRCTNKSNKSYFRYGGRGIKVCELWEKSFEAFYKDMGERPNKYYSLERIENSKGYYKENCKWATRKEQARNFRHNHLLEFNRESKCISEWGEIYGLHHDTIASRLDLGWSIEKALTTSVKINKKISYKGEMMPIATVEKILGFGNGTISYRLKNGLSEYDAINNPLQNKKLIEKA